MNDTEKPMGMLIRFPCLDGWVTYSTDQLEGMTTEQLEVLRNLPVSPDNPLAKERRMGQGTNAETVQADEARPSGIVDVATGTSRASKVPGKASG